MKLGDVAEFNLHKTGRRWKNVESAKGPRNLFDEEFPTNEQLPRQMDIFIEEESGIAITTIDGSKFGDPLTDNRDEDDGYRFHDIYHFPTQAYSVGLPHLELFCDASGRAIQDLIW